VLGSYLISFTIALTEKLIKQPVFVPHSLLTHSKRRKVCVHMCMRADNLLDAAVDLSRSQKTLLKGRHIT